jgi:phage/plasmid-associated DNA primase
MINHSPHQSRPLELRQLPRFPCQAENKKPLTPHGFTAELPGIANRCLAAYRRLCARGGFIQPKAGLDLERKIEARVNPFYAFMADCWIRDDSAKGPTVSGFYSVFETWCINTDREYLLAKTPRQLLIQKVNEVDDWAWLKSMKPHAEPRRYAGISRKLSEEEQEKADARKAEVEKIRQEG